MPLQAAAPHEFGAAGGGGLQYEAARDVALELANAENIDHGASRSAVTRYTFATAGR